MIVEDKDVKYTGTEGVPHAIQKDGEGEKRKTGDWRVFKPIMHHEACIACDMCWAACPDAAITMDKDGKPIVNYELCKGCLICQQVCPKKEEAVEKVRDTHHD